MYGAADGPDAGPVNQAEARALQRLGDRVRDLRLGAGMTQEALAARSGLTSKYLSRLENGNVNPSILVVQSIAERGFGLSLPALLEGHPQSRRPQDRRRARTVPSEIEEISGLLLDEPARVRRAAVHVVKALLRRP